MLLTHAVQPDASEVISEAWFYVATYFLTDIWDRRCWHQKDGIFFLIFSQKMGINILGGPLRKSNRKYICLHTAMQGGHKSDVILNGIIQLTIASRTDMATSCYTICDLFIYLVI